MPSTASAGLAANSGVPAKRPGVNVTSEMALVGPFIRCDDEPKIEATAVTTIAE